MSAPVRNRLPARPAMPWAEQAACREVDTEVFFPDPWKGEGCAPAIAICRRCPVRRDCLEYAIAHHERHGVWGGCSERERQRIARGRRDRRAA